ncbi:hypothetical protein RhiirC2_787963 [Rhizophagus irregularis]|uniref:F-box domain-containing protein n=1 Tax=Rhizophagus irregularis TaxID=588596 RepID=A0A2N1MR43_9GLOM|nr:hypothetical protein RhiirC2_787963 [Rhizophagus irregularis]
MSKLNKDILYLIFEKLQDDKEALPSCLLINKTWCEMIIPILWKNPWKYLKRNKEKILLNVIISHFSEESKNELKIKCIDISTQKPLFNYISFCKHLNLNVIQKLINTINERSKLKIIKKEILKLFINEDAKFTHLYIPSLFDYQIHLIPGAKSCFSKIEYLNCSTNTNRNILTGLTNICNSIKELELIIKKDSYNYEITKLVEAQEDLIIINLNCNDNQFVETLNKLIKLLKFH